MILKIQLFFLFLFSGLFSWADENNKVNNICPVISGNYSCHTRLKDPSDLLITEESKKANRITLTINHKIQDGKTIYKIEVYPSLSSVGNSTLKSKFTLWNFIADGREYTILIPLSELLDSTDSFSSFFNKETSVLYSHISLCEPPDSLKINVKTNISDFMKQLIPFLQQEQVADITLSFFLKLTKIDNDNLVIKTSVKTEVDEDSNSHGDLVDLPFKDYFNKINKTASYSCQRF